MLQTSRSTRDTILNMGGCVGLWLCDERSGTIARDLTNTNNGTITGSPTLGQPTLTVGTNEPSVNYGSSASNYISLKTNGVIIGGLANSSVVASMKTTVGRTLNSNGDVIYGERPPTGNDIWKFHAGGPGTELHFTHRDDAGTLFQSGVGSGAVNDGRAHVVGFTKAGTTCRCYVDGLDSGGFTSNGTDTLTSATVECRIGSDAADNTAYFHDWLGFVAIFNRKLSPGDMRHIAVTALGM